ncbi:MAG TPA: hypothetical protein VII58_04890 [Acidobacteriaceae bacterium]
MDEEQSEELDAALETSSDEEFDAREKAEFHARAGGEVSLI